jgi:large subunit ribosomal protein L3
MEKKAIIGKKVGMTQIFDEAGKVIPVTVIEAGPCTVVQKKTAEKDGYEAIQLGYQPTTEKHLTKAQLGHLAKAGVEEKLRVLKEVELDKYESLNVGDVLKADTFVVGDKVDATGISKGKGYAGVVKRYNAQRTPMSHGGGPVHRHAGSMGSTSTPSRIRKGKIGAGQMGAEQVTVQNLEVVKVDPEINLLAVRGAIPGPKGGIVVIKSTAKVNVVKQAGAGISLNPQKASGRNPQKASARNH